MVIGTLKRPLPRTPSKTVQAYWVYTMLMSVAMMVNDHLP